MEMNEAQLRAIHCDGHTLVVACPGSGKTRVLVSKSSKVLSSEINRLMVVTFTRESAREIAHRMVEEVKKADTLHSSKERIVAGTFHSVALKYLLGVNAMSKVIGPEDQAHLAKRAWENQCNPSTTPYEAFEQYMNGGGLYSLESESTGSELEQAFKEYENLLIHHDAIDLNGLLDRALNEINVRRAPPFGVTHLFVDEFQDVDKTQLDWVIAMANVGVIVTVVCDDDQSIYKFRSALGYNAIQALRSAIHPVLVKLEINYRTFKEILGVASRLINNNEDRIQKTIVSAKGIGGEIELKQFWMDSDEHAGILSCVSERYSNLCVIARTNFILDPIEALLREHNIEVYRPGKGSILTKPESALLIGLLGYKSGDQQARILMETLLVRSGVRDQIAMSCVELNSNLKRINKDATHQELQAIEILRNTIESMRGKSDIKKLRLAAEYFQSLERINANLKSSQIDLAIAILEDHPSLLERACNNTLAKEKKKTPDLSNSMVTLLTMHGSKGLEFDNVWVVAAVEGISPSKKTEDIAEERRLFYVAMTRSRNSLTISYHAKRGKIKCKPSRFVSLDIERTDSIKDEVINTSW